MDGYSAVGAAAITGDAFVLKMLVEAGGLLFLFVNNKQNLSNNFSLQIFHIFFKENISKDCIASSYLQIVLSQVACVRAADLRAADSQDRTPAIIAASNGTALLLFSFFFMAFSSL